MRWLKDTGHIRIPYYIRGKAGAVHSYCGSYLNPEDLAVGRTAGPAVPLYRVAFAQRDVWLDYAGPAHDDLLIEIYEHWLQPAKDAGNA